MKSKFTIWAFGPYGNFYELKTFFAKDEESAERHMKRIEYALKVRGEMDDNAHLNLYCHEEGC